MTRMVAASARDAFEAHLIARGISDLMTNGGFVKAREWLDRGNQETDPIDAFASYWRGFNTLFFGAAEGPEREKIKACLSQGISERDAEEILHAYKSEIAFLLERPVIDMRQNGRDSEPNIQAFGTATASLVKLQEVFMVIYQVRCNLEHGQKSPSNGRDIQLCQHASRLVADIVSRNT